MSISYQHYIIKGKVQGVGYRNFAKNKADKLKLMGWVKNLPNGDVECVVTGEQETLKDFEAYLKKGPSLSHVISVDKIHEKSISSSEDFSNFDIRY